MKLLSIVLSIFFCVQPGYAEDLGFDGNVEGGFQVKDYLSDYLVPAPNIPAKMSDGAIKIWLLNEQGDPVLVQPDKNWFNPEGVREDHYVFQPGAKIWETVTCDWRDSRPWSAEVSYSFEHDQYGAHFHSEPLPPALSISRSYSNIPPDNSFVEVPSPISTPVTPNQTPYKFWIRLPVFATRINFLTRSFDSCADQYKTAVVDVRYLYGGNKELQPMPVKGKNYILYNSTTAASFHPWSHYGTKELVDALTAASDAYRAACPKAKVVYINDMSLPWGGKFDLNLKWKSGSHEEHQTGLNADIGKRHIRKSNRAKFIETMCKKFNVASEGDGEHEAPHYHVAYKTGNSAIDGGFFERAKEDPRFIPCCPVPNPIPADWACIKLQSSGGNVEETETPTDCK